MTGKETRPTTPPGGGTTKKEEYEKKVPAAAPAPAAASNVAAAAAAAAAPARGTVVQPTVPAAATAAAAAAQATTAPAPASRNAAGAAGSSKSSHPGGRTKGGKRSSGGGKSSTTTTTTTTGGGGTGSVFPGAVPVAGINSNGSKNDDGEEEDYDDGRTFDDDYDLESGIVTQDTPSSTLTTQPTTTGEAPPVTLEAELVVEEPESKKKFAVDAEQPVVYDAEEVTNLEQRNQSKYRFIALSCVLATIVVAAVVVVVLVVVLPQTQQQDQQQEGGTPSSTPPSPPSPSSPTLSPTLDPNRAQWITLVGDGIGNGNGTDVNSSSIIPRHIEWGDPNLFDPSSSSVGAADDVGFGTTVDVSSDGRTLVAAAPFSSPDTTIPFKGQCFVYDWHDDQGEGEGAAAAAATNGTANNMTTDNNDQVGSSDDGGYWKLRGKPVSGPVSVGTIGANGNLVISGDGTTIAFSTMIVEENIGFVEVWRWISDADAIADTGGDSEGDEEESDGGGGEWIQLGSTLKGKQDQDQLGSSLALSQDGNTLALGAFMRNVTNAQFGIGGPGPGRATVYDFVVGATDEGEGEGPGAGGAGEWIIRGESLVGQGIEMLGVSMDLSSDGQIVAVSAYEYSTWPISVVNTNTNTNMNTTSSSSSNDTNSSTSTTSTELQPHGRTVIYQWNTTTTPPSWTQLGSDIVGASARVESISLSGDGTTIAISSDSYGRPASNSNGLGSLRVFDYFSSDGESQGGEWIQRGQAMYQSSKSDRYAISLSENGQRVASSIGFGFDYNDGVVEVHEWDEDDGIWTTIGQPLEGSSPNALLGHSVALSGDGSRVVLGAPGHTHPIEANNANKGRVEIYQWKDGTS